MIRVMVDKEVTLNGHLFHPLLLKALIMIANSFSGFFPMLYVHFYSSTIKILYM